MAARMAVHSIGRIGEPEGIADAVLQLSSGKFSVVASAAVSVDGRYRAR